MDTNTTLSFREKLYYCYDIDDLKKDILPLLQDQRTAWEEKIGQILSQTGYSCRELAQLCKVSEQMVRKWRTGSLPQNRDMYLRIGFAAGYDLEQMNHFLTRYGKCPQLYAKSLEDSIARFLLNSPTLPHTYEEYLRLLELVKEEMKKEVQEAPEPAQDDYTTMQQAKDMAGIASLEEMIDFAKSRAPEYKKPYARLYSYILMNLRANLETKQVVEKDAHRKRGDQKQPSFHAMATENQWSASLRRCISEIRSKRWFPRRSKIISLGVHLNMDTDAIDKMLELAQMEPLYPKNPLEMAVQWAVCEFQLNCEDDQMQDGIADLRDFVKSVLVRLELEDENSGLLDEL